MRFFASGTSKTGLTNRGWIKTAINEDSLLKHYFEFANEVKKEREKGKKVREQREPKELAKKKLEKGKKIVKLPQWEQPFMKQQKIRIGMSQDGVRLSWGYPDKINRSIYSFGVHDNGHVDVESMTLS